MVDRTLDDAEGRSAAAPKAGPDPRRPPAWTDRVPDLLASYLAAVATFCAVTALLPVLREPLAWLRTAIEIVSVGAPPSLATAAFLGILAAAVRRRMRAAWWFVVLYLVLGRILGWITVLIDTDAQDPVVVSAGSGVLAWLRVGFGVAGLVLLLVARKRFTARTQRGSGWRALGLYLGVVVLGGLLGWGLLELFPGTLRTTEDRVGWAFTFVLGGLGDPDVTGVDGAAPYAVTFVLGLVGVFAVLAAAYVLFRPAPRQRRLDPDDEQRLRACSPATATATRSATSPPAATRRWSSPRAARPRSPTGSSAASAWPAATRSATPRPGRRPSTPGWPRRARYGWIPAVMGASEDGRRAPTRGAGLDAPRARRRGDRRRRRLRPGRPRPCGRCARRCTGSSGPATPCTDPPPRASCPPRRWREVVERADAWRDTETERGFSMALGRLGDPADGELRAGRGARRRRARCGRCCRFVPWGRDGLSLDLMRRDRDADNGLIEFMVAELVAAARGARRRAGLAELRHVPGGLRARASGSAPGRCCGSGARLLLFGRAGGSSSRCTAPTPSTSRSGRRASCASGEPATCPASASPRRSPRASSPRRACGGCNATASSRRRRQARRSPSCRKPLRTPTRSPRRSPRCAARLPEQVAGAPRQARTAARRGHRPLPGGLSPAPRGLAQVRERFGHLGAGRRTAEQVVGDRPGGAACATTAGCASPCCRTATRDSR